MALDDLNNTPEVTVYVTNYNYSRYVRLAIESVYKQSYSSFEVLVIDDCSTDDSVAVLIELQKEFGFDLFTGVKRGLNETNNFALSKARGKYLVRLDADDILHPSFLGVMVSVLQGNEDVNLAFPNYYLIDRNGEVFAEERRNDFTSKEVLKDLPAHGACTVVRTSELRRLGGYFEGVTCQDGYDLWLKLGVRGKVEHVPLPLFYYRQHGMNLTTNHNRILNCRRRIKELFVAQCMPQIELNCLIIVPIKAENVDGLDQGTVKRQLDNLGRDLEKRGVRTSYVLMSSGTLESDWFEKSQVMTRPAELEKTGVSLKESLRFVKENGIVSTWESIVVINVENQFPESDLVFECLITSKIFETSSVITVTRDKGSLYFHDGSGLKNVIEDSNVIWERNELFRAVSSVYVFPASRSFYSSLLGSRIGHVEIPTA